MSRPHHEITFEPRTYREIARLPWTENFSIRLDFAERRLHDLEDLNNGNLASADPNQRQQLIQEYFFHLVGAIEMLAQLVNTTRGLGISRDEVTLARVLNTLGQKDAIRSRLSALCKNTRAQPLPKDPYSEEGLIYRIINSRHQVTHRALNPFHFVNPALATAEIFLYLDPRNKAQGHSRFTVLHELRIMFALVKQRCEAIQQVLY